MSGRKRIIYVLNAFVHDAPNSVITSIGAGMVDDGYEVLYVAWSRGGPLEEKLAAAGARTAVLGRGLLGGALALNKLIQDFSPAIVHASLARPTLGVALAKLIGGKRGVAWITSEHGVHEWQEKGHSRGKLMEAVMPAILSQLDSVVTVSDQAAIELYRRGLRRDQVHIISNGVDVCRFYPRPKAERRQYIQQMFPADTDPDAIFFMGTAGNLRALKGFDVLIAALGQVLVQFPNVRLVIWGEGPELKALEEEALTVLPGTSKAVHFAGFETDLQNYLPLLDLYVQPSRVESFGMAAAEAMACEVPVIVSDAGGLKSLVQQGQSGLLFSVDDTEKLAEQVLYMITHTRQRESMAKAGRLRVLQHYTLQSMLRRIKDVYASVLPGTGGST